jgi:hypothetical protein
MGVEIRTPKIILLDTRISDASAWLGLKLCQNLGHAASPFTLSVAGDFEQFDWDLPMGVAGDLASGARWAEKCLSREPKARVAFRSKRIPFDDGTVQVFELGTVAEPPFLYVSWTDVRVLLTPSKQSELFIAAERMGDLVSEMGGGGSLRLANAGRGAGWRGWDGT